MNRLPSHHLPRRPHRAPRPIVRCIAFWLALPLGSAPAVGSDDFTLWLDPAGDGAVRRTDSGSDGPLIPGATIPDLTSVMLSGWSSPTASTNPFAGMVVEGEGAALFRLDATFDGLVNPPGELFDDLGDYTPFTYGPNPVLGFIDIDLDDDRDTGGELDGAATLRYLANVARFGGLPYGSIGVRAARSGNDLDSDFFFGPQYERTGADFALVLCGCSAVTILSRTGGDQDTTFEQGETWIIQGRFFERAQGYREAGNSQGGVPNVIGLYNPLVKLRFSHDLGADTTTVSLVYALTMAGAGQLAGQAPQPINTSVADQTSIVEALTDLIAGAGCAGCSGPARTLVTRWEGEEPDDPNLLDPTRWEVSSFLVGMAYAEPQDSLYAWTDAGFETTFRDLDSDGLVGAADRAALMSARTSLDGGPNDADGVVNGTVVLFDPGPNFSVYDLNSDARIDAADLALFSGGTADINGDGIVNVQDFLTFLTLYDSGHPLADFTGDGRVTVADFLQFLILYSAG